MGAWGYGLYDNDSALDAISKFEHYEREIGVEKAINKLLEIEWVSKDNACILVIADLQIRKLKKIDEGIYDIVIDTIDQEILNIENWIDPQERLSILTNFKQRVERYK